MQAAVATFAVAMPAAEAFPCFQRVASEPLLLVVTVSMTGVVMSVIPAAVFVMMMHIVFVSLRSGPEWRRRPRYS